MIFCGNSRVSSSTYRLCKLFLVVQLVIMPYNAHAQWSQTLGWGGAGHGKRSHGPFTDSTRQISSADTCSPNTFILRIAKQLVESELKKLENCKFGPNSIDEARRAIFDEILTQ